MNLNKDIKFDSLVSFLQGASWATVIIGAYLLFTLFYPFGLIVALVAGFFGAIIGLFMVVFFEMAHIQEEMLKETREQNALLREYLKKGD